MPERELMRGNEALAEAAVRCGCRYYFGYPITPQTEILEYMAKRLPEVGGVFLQSESELAAISMVHGAAAAGKRVLTASSGPGISLMQEGISYLASAELPCVIVNVMRAGPGLGTIPPSQGDYLQATKGGGHGDYRLIVLAPASVQEMADLCVLAFDLADRYRTVVMILADGVLGEMMEGVVLPEMDCVRPEPKPWAVTGAKGRPRNVVVSAPLDHAGLLELNQKLQEKYRQIEAKEVRWEALYIENAELIVTAFGTCARVALEAVEQARKKGYKVGLFRPITLWPFPYQVFKQAATTTKKFLVVEMNAGQMLEDVHLGVMDKAEIWFYGRPGGGVPEPEAVLDEILKIMGAEVR